MEFDPKKIDILLKNDSNNGLGNPQNNYVRNIKRHNKELQKEISRHNISHDDVESLFLSDLLHTPVQLDASHHITSIVPAYQKLEITPSWIKNSVKKQTKEQKQLKKSKKKGKAAMKTLSYLLDERAIKPANAMAEYVKGTTPIIKKDGCLWLYDETDGSFHACDENELSAKIRDELPEELQLRTTSREYSEAYKQLNISKDIEIENDFNANIPYVNCLSGVIDIRTGELLKHDPSFLFTSCIQSHYTPNAKCPKFIEYLKLVTNGDRDLMRLFRSVTGYLISSYTDAKAAILIYGEPQTGKSLYCHLITKIIGEEYVGNIDLDLLQRIEFVASLKDKKVNIAPDLTTKVMKDPGFFKSLISHLDSVTVRKPYHQPITVRGGCKMIFATNHLLQMDSSLEAGDLEATFNRFQYLPYLNKPIPCGLENRNLAEEIIAEEKDAVFSWAIEGIRDYISFNGFPPCEAAESLKRRNMAMYCSEKYFLSECINFDESRYESTELVKRAYQAFCREIGVQPKNIGKYLQENAKILKTKVRVNENGYKQGNCKPINVFEGIRLRKKYRKLAYDTTLDEE